MMIVILVAVQEELSANDVPGYHIEYSGVGKINAAIKTLEVIDKFAPSLIINFGTAGTLRDGLSGLVEVARFYQRDMDASPLGFAVGETPYDNIAEIHLSDEGYSCGTGDQFVTQTPALQTDIVDMEAYAIAKICYMKNINFKCYKYISDNANENAQNDWVENVSMGKKLFIEKLQNLTV